MGDYARWIRKQIETNRPYNEFVTDLITASGRNTDGEVALTDLPPAIRDRPNAQFLVNQINRQPSNPAASYYAVSRDPLDVASATSQVFLGVRVECARCHNHPFEKWTQDDFYGLAAFFSGLTARGNLRIPVIVQVSPRGGQVRHPKSNEIVEPRTLDNADLKLGEGMDRRPALAAWITSDTNPWFARAVVNRIWGHYFGRGIVEPIDDFRATNPASNPELLDALAKDLVAHHFDLRHIHRTILNSRTYQQSSRPNQWNREDTSNFARFYPKRLTAEELYDSISQATGIFLGPPGGRRRGPGLFVPPQYRDILPDAPLTRVMQLAAVPGRGAGNNDLFQFLGMFGKPRREVVCECERSSEGNMGQALALINGNEINDKIVAPGGRVQQLTRSGRPEAEQVEELYLAALSRRPTAVEAGEAAALVRSGQSRGEGIEDLAWSLLNSREFLFNH